MAQTLVAVAAVGALLLFLSIGGLFASQMITAGDNMTTLEAFVPGINDRVCDSSMFRTLLILGTGPKIWRKYSAKIIGFYRSTLNCPKVQPMGMRVHQRGRKWCTSRHKFTAGD